MWLGPYSCNPRVDELVTANHRYFSYFVPTLISWVTLSTLISPTSARQFFPCNHTIPTHCSNGKSLFHGLNNCLTQLGTKVLPTVFSALTRDFASDTELLVNFPAHVACQTNRCAFRWPPFFFARHMLCKRLMVISLPALRDPP